MISKESYDKGVRCKGMCGICSKMNKCYQFKQEGLSGIKPIFEPLKEPVYEPPKNPIINNTTINKTTISADVIAEILNNPNVESVSINYDKVGEVEKIILDIKRKDDAIKDDIENKIKDNLKKMYSHFGVVLTDSLEKANTDLYNNYKYGSATICRTMEDGTFENEPQIVDETGKKVLASFKYNKTRKMVSGVNFYDYR